MLESLEQNNIKRMSVEEPEQNIGFDPLAELNQYRTDIYTMLQENKGNESWLKFAMEVAWIKKIDPGFDLSHDEKTKLLQEFERSTWDFMSFRFRQTLKIFGVDTSDTELYLPEFRKRVGDSVQQKDWVSLADECALAKELETQSFGFKELSIEYKSEIVNQYQALKKKKVWGRALRLGSSIRGLYTDVDLYLSPGEIAEVREMIDELKAGRHWSNLLELLGCLKAFNLKTEPGEDHKAMPNREAFNT